MVAEEADRRVVADYTSSRRRRESLMWRYIVRRELGADVEILYDENGAPKLANREVCVGVSHSDDFVAVLLSATRCAVDIERLDRDFERVAERYVSAEERALSQDERLLATVWSAKETLYKYAGERGLNLLEDLHIDSVDFENGHILGRIRNSDPVKMYLTFHLGNVVVYIV